jgi:two-component system, sensor histidine kinase SagS
MAGTVGIEGRETSDREGSCSVTRVLCLATSSDSPVPCPVAPPGAALEVLTDPLDLIGLLGEPDVVGVYVPVDPKGSPQGAEWRLATQLGTTYALMDRLPDGLAIVDANGVLVWANERMRHWFPGPPLSGRQFYSALGRPEISGPDVHPLNTALQNRQTTSAQLSSGGRYFRVQFVPVLENTGAVRYLMVSLVDTTETTTQRQKLAALHQAELALADLTAREVFEMDVEQRKELLKDNILHYTRDLLNYNVVEIRLLDEQTGLLEPLLSVGIDSEASKRPLYARADGNGVTGFVVATGNSYLCEDTTHDPLYLEGLMGGRSSLTVPLRMHDRIIGSFNVESPEVSAFDESDLEFLQSFARGVAAALNTLELLSAQRTNSTQESIEAVHGAVAPLVDRILNDTVQVMGQFMGHDPGILARLQAVLDRAREIKQLITRIGEKMAPTEDLPAALQPVARTGLRGRRVLVIDADEAVRNSAHQLLEKHGCIVETAGTGQEAVLMVSSLSKGQTYNSIIADIRLPDISGYDLLVRLKELLTNPPLILMTGFGYDPGHSIVKARQARVGAVLYKPFRPDQLIDTLIRIGEEGHSGQPPAA